MRPYLRKREEGPLSNYNNQKQITEDLRTAGSGESHHDWLAVPASVLEES